MPTTSYSEEQRFSWGWFWTIFVLAVLPGVVLIGYGIVQQLIYGIPFGRKPLPDVALLVLGVAFFGFLFGMCWIFLAGRLTIEAREEELYVKYAPFLTRHFRYEDITSCHAREYSPLMEFGGWGIRYNFRTWVYNVSGNKGVQLTFKHRAPLLLGSQRSEELASVIRGKCGM